MLQVKLVKSPIGNTKRNRATVAALGLRKMHQTVVLPDNESVRGMIFKVKHMLAVEVVEGDSAGRKASQPKRAKTGRKPVAEAAPRAPKAKAEPAKAQAALADEPAAKAEAPAKAKDEKPKAAAKGKSESKTKAEAKPKTPAKKPASKTAKKKES
jgi:large subunit ribosomal protein L30